MKIFQVKYNSGKYAYYMAKSISIVNSKTTLYNSYTDCRDAKNPLNVFEQEKLRESLVNYFK